MVISRLILGRVFEGEESQEQKSESESGDGLMNRGLSIDSQGNWLRVGPCSRQGSGTCTVTIGSSCRTLTSLLVFTSKIGISDP